MPHPLQPVFFYSPCPHDVLFSFLFFFFFFFLAPYQDLSFLKIERKGVNKAYRSE